MTEGPGLAIRPLRASDAAAALALARALPEWFNAAGLARMESELAGHAGLAAEVSSALAGFITWAPYGSEADAIEVSWLAVERARHGAGIGSALCREMNLRAVRAGVRTVYVSTLADTIEYPPYDATRRFWLRQGFGRVRVDPAHWGEGNDRLLLRLALPSS